MHDRADLIRSMVRLEGHGLEIGPSYGPIIRKSDNHNIKIVDHCTTAELREKYRNEPGVDANLIEEVDFVWDGRSLVDVIGNEKCFDYIIASHVIEHTPDMLGFIKQCAALLTDDGVLVLAVPDKRRCFDALRPLSSTGAVLQADLDGRTVHTAGVAFDHVAYFATMNGAGGWLEQPDYRISLSHPLDFASQIFDRSVKSKDYFDFHAWVFTPSSFRLIVEDLAQLDELPIREREFHPTDGNEFIISLSANAAGCGLKRQDLHNAIAFETRRSSITVTE